MTNQTNPIVDLGLGILYGYIIRYLCAFIVFVCLMYGALTNDTEFLRHSFLFFGSIIISFVCVGVPVFLLTFFIKCLWWAPWVATFIVTILLFMEVISTPG